VFLSVISWQLREEKPADSATSTSKAQLSFVKPEFENSTKIPNEKRSYEFDPCFGPWCDKKQLFAWV